MYMSQSDIWIDQINPVDEYQLYTYDIKTKKYEIYDY